MLVFREENPTPEEYYDLFETTGWNKEYQANPDELANALENSWYSIAVYDSDRLIGFGRVVSDGVLHAMIYDMIVRPSHKNRGIGTEILSRLVAKCKQAGVRDIQLFAVKNKARFYLKCGFVRRPQEAPGMELREEKDSEQRHDTEA